LFLVWISDFLLMEKLNPAADLSLDNLNVAHFITKQQYLPRL
jgi:hypothetical protein